MKRPFSTRLSFTGILIGIVSLNLAGCSGTGDIRAQVAGANIEIARSNAIAAAKPVLDASIPTPNGVMHIVVHAPQGGGSAQVSMPDDPAWRVAGQAVGVLGTGVNFLVGGKAAVGLVQATAGGIVKALQAMPDPVIVQPATPIIVPPAEPVIVEPVIVNPVIVPPTEPVIVEPVIVNPVIVQAP